MFWGSGCSTELSKGMLGEEAPGSLQGVTSAFLPSSKTGLFGERKLRGATLRRFGGRNQVLYFILVTFAVLLDSSPVGLAGRNSWPETTHSLFFLKGCLSLGIQR